MSGALPARRRDWITLALTGTLPSIGKGYPFFVAEAPWKLAASSEYTLTIAKGPIRVLLFELTHPTFPPQWGVVAFWRDRGLSAFAIGPDASFQAEALQILRRQGPH